MTILWLKAFHVIAVIAWMAGMLYLPRLFVYHTETVPGSPESERFKTMERRLLRAIMNPAMIVVWLLGIAMIVIEPGYMQQGWLHAKLGLVLIMTGLHGYLSKLRKDFARDANKHQREYDREPYKSRHLIENFFCNLKQFRAIATRYDKTARNFLAAIHLAAAITWLN